LNVRQARWLAFISEYDFEIRHIKGKENKVADALSRSMHAIHLEAINTCESDLKSKIKEALGKDEYFLQVKEGLQQEPPNQKFDGYQITEEGLMIYKDILYILMQRS
jgi:hypothetical protein